MAGIDICMLTTQASGQMLSSRPMSNNGEVEYDGESYFFTYEKAGMVREIKANDEVNLAFSGKNMLFISVQGKARLSTDKAAMKEHWNKDLDRWFPEGLDTPGVCMIQVSAHSIKYWQKEDEGLIEVGKK